MTTTATKERPILFTGPMVRAILNGTKTQTRRPVKLQPPETHGICRKLESMKGDIGRVFMNEVDADGNIIPGKTSVCTRWSPLGKPGDRLWVRETWGLFDTIPSDGPSRAKVFYRAADGERHDLRYQLWRPSIHMPRWASRLTLEITAVRVERVQSITEEDALREGIYSMDVSCAAPIHVTTKFVATGVIGTNVYNEREIDAPVHESAKAAFECLWDSIYYKPFPWASNPWVWVYEFKRIESKVTA